MAARPEEELTRLLYIVEEAKEINKQRIGRPSQGDPAGWSIDALSLAEQLHGLAGGLHYALGIHDSLAEVLLEKGPARFIQDREDQRVKQAEILRQVQRGELGGQNG